MTKKLIQKLKITKFVRWLARNRRKETHINRALKRLGSDTYVEIGVCDGGCFRQINARRKFAIDPNLSAAGKPSLGEEFFEMESDDFFNKHAAELFRQKGVDVALVDGLHEFEQALRDVLNLEHHMAANGVIFMHDCNPVSSYAAGDVHPGGDWNGDVWKVIHYLRTYRKDLEVFTLDCDWGVGVIRGFSKTENLRQIPLDAVRICKNLEYSYLAANRRDTLSLRAPTWREFSVLV